MLISFKSPEKMNEILDVIYKVEASIGLIFNLNQYKSLSFFNGQHNKVQLKLCLKPFLL